LAWFRSTWPVNGALLAASACGYVGLLWRLGVVTLGEVAAARKVLRPVPAPEADAELAQPPEGVTYGLGGFRARGARGARGAGGGCSRPFPRAHDLARPGLVAGTDAEVLLLDGHDWRPRSLEHAGQRRLDINPVDALDRFDDRRLTARLVGDHLQFGHSVFR